MGLFQIKKETRSPFYTGKSALSKGRAALFALAALGFIGAQAGFSGDNVIPLRGVVAYIPDIKNKDQLVLIADKWFKERMGLAMKHDVQLVLKEGTNEIRFEADGYNAEKKVGYEWTSSYYSDTNDPAKTLSWQETGLLKDFRFGSNYIITIYQDYKTGVIETLEYFYSNFYIKTNNGK